MVTFYLCFIKIKIIYCIKIKIIYCVLNKSFKKFTLFEKYTHKFAIYMSQGWCNIEKCYTIN
jgi:uncharacterized membrane protein YagU involved in acid resistance